MEDYLLRRLDRPLAWLAVFGGAGLFGGALAGWSGELPGGVLGGAALVGGSVGMLGLLFGTIAWAVCRLTGGLDQPARHPALWARTLRCSACDWKTTPEGPVSRRDCLSPPTRCPVCTSNVIPHVPDCPHCATPVLTGASIPKDMRRLVRWPRTRGQALHGHYRCRSCHGDFDRWGRPA